MPRLKGLHGTISNEDIERYCMLLGLDLVGCFSKDETPSKKYCGGYYINLANHGEEGTHWVFLYIADNGDAVYYDPFGVQYAPKHIESFLKGLKVYRNTQEIQDPHSDLCGLFCLGLHWWIEHKKGSLKDKIENYNEIFSDDTRDNDKILMDFLEKDKYKRF